MILYMIHVYSSENDGCTQVICPTHKPKEKKRGEGEKSPIHKMDRMILYLCVSGMSRGIYVQISMLIYLLHTLKGVENL